jgi:hypothetical protein
MRKDAQHYILWCNQYIFGRNWKLDIRCRSVTVTRWSWVCLDPRASNVIRDYIKFERMPTKLFKCEISVNTKYNKALFCDVVSACTNMAVLCCVILSVPVPMWQCSVVWYCQCLYQRGSAVLCDIVNTCTNVAVLFCVILSAPVPMWQCSVVWYCQWLHQCGSAFLTGHAVTDFGDTVGKAVCCRDKMHCC